MSQTDILSVAPIAFKNILISKVSVSGASGDDHPTCDGCESFLWVQGCFAPPADNSLRKNGKYLTTGLEKRKVSVLSIFRVWDNIFFPGRSNVSARAENDRGGMVDAMDLLNAEKEPENNDEDGGDDKVLQAKWCSGNSLVLNFGHVFEVFLAG
ncbi:hypothetical protein B0H14DRAFT_2608992 [Mycena olivaceomarginata]|nr:hypothetical protein B0H14DRAFT_2608992 [Mycena olivaceomarginata]